MTTTMKAIRIHQRGAPDVMRLEDLPLPQPAAGEVLIQVAASGINFSDVGQRRGSYPNLLDLPCILGSEVAGTITALGEGVSGLRPGDRVTALVSGGYAEYATAAADAVYPIPPAVSFAQATVVPIQGQTAYLLLEKAARLLPGETVLVHAAAGGVGSLAVQVAKRLGAGLVIGSDITPDKLAYIRSLGADAAVNTTDPDWMAEVMRLTHGRGVDVALDPVGGEIGQQTLFTLADFGRQLVFGALKDEMTPLVAQMLIHKCLTVSGYNTVAQPLADKQRASRALLDWIAAGQLTVTLDDSWPLAQAADAHRALEAYATHGKVTLRI